MSRRKKEPNSAPEQARRAELAPTEIKIPAAPQSETSVLPAGLADIIKRTQARLTALAGEKHAAEELVGVVAEETTLRDVRYKKHLSERATVAEAALPNAFAAEQLAALEKSGILTSQDVMAFQTIDTEFGKLKGTQDKELRGLTGELFQARKKLQAEVVLRAQAAAHQANVDYDTFFQPHKPTGSGPDEKDLGKNPGLFMRIWNEALGINQAMEAAQKKEAERMRAEAVRRLEGLERRQIDAMTVIDDEIMRLKPEQKGVVDQISAMSAELNNKLSKAGTPRERDVLTDEAKVGMNAVRDKLLVQTLERILDQKGQYRLSDVYPMTRPSDPKELIQGQPKYDLLVADLRNSKFSQPLESDPESKERLAKAMRRDLSFRILFAPDVMKRVFGAPAEVREQRRATKEREKYAAERAAIEAQQRATLDAEQRQAAETRRLADEAVQAAQAEASRAAREQAAKEQIEFQRGVENKGGFTFQLINEPVGVVMQKPSTGKYQGRWMVGEIIGPGAVALRKSGIVENTLFMENNRSVPAAMRAAFQAWRRKQDLAATATRKEAEQAPAQPPEEEAQQQAS